MKDIVGRQAVIEVNGERIRTVVTGVNSLSCKAKIQGVKSPLEGHYKEILFYKGWGVNYKLYFNHGQENEIEVRGMDAGVGGAERQEREEPESC